MARFVNDSKPERRGGCRIAASGPEPVMPRRGANEYSRPVPPVANGGFAANTRSPESGDCCHRFSRGLRHDPWYRRE
jgi:hypothetical protein